MRTHPSPSPNVDSVASRCRSSRDAAESPRTQRWPGTSSGRSTPSSSTTLHLVPRTTGPGRARAAPRRLGSTRRCASSRSSRCRRGSRRRSGRGTDATSRRAAPPLPETRESNRAERVVGDVGRVQRRVERGDAEEERRLVLSSRSRRREAGVGGRVASRIATAPDRHREGQRVARARRRGTSARPRRSGRRRRCRGPTARRSRR